MKKGAYTLFLALLLAILLTACQPRATHETPLDVQEAVLGKPLEVSFISAPAQGEPGENFTVTWQVTGEPGGNISHTALHYDTVSHEPDFKLYRKASTIRSGKTPQVFSVSLKATEEKYMYLRAHAIVDGAHIYSGEKQISVAVKVTPVEPKQEIQPQPEQQPQQTPQPEQSQSSAKEYAIEADDDAFYPASIEVSKGDQVKLTLKVRETNVYYAGLLFTSGETGYDSGDVSPGASTVYEFTADNSFEIDSWWPSSRRFKATLKVNVR